MIWRELAQALREIFDYGADDAYRALRRWFFEERS